MHVKKKKYSREIIDVKYFSFKNRHEFMPDIINKELKIVMSKICIFLLHSSWLRADNKPICDQNSLRTIMVTNQEMNIIF